MTTQTTTTPPRAAGTEGAAGLEAPAGTEGADADPEAAIARARADIDALDEEIVRLLRRRMALSEGVQHIRMARGGRRTDLARENEVLRRWHAELGQPGTALAMTLLELCRGRV
ncbi:chorismate mutase [Streptomyces zhaozhouensis]|uniref:Chorismate mutase n=1 Tax=Streptomyces zhaozhouensis TaxID=1300267 RepID=A0A286DTJ4_9ACTN|nr:chorismate mutase [Streptomyces zhaozhouensis]SOD61955.1 chorismate mutase [Streptomyces zhaozhouensis]